MPDDKKIRLLDLVDGALAVAADERSAWLDQACGDDVELRAEVETLLSYHEEADDLLSVSDQARRTVTTSPTPADVGAPALGAPQVGTQLGDYLIESQIGAGGMGVVYQARQLTLNRTVALKVLPAYLRNSPKIHARFLREVEAAARLRHDNIVAVYTTGEEGDATFYAMELIDGPPLSELIASLRSCPIPELQSKTPLPESPSSESAKADASKDWIELVLKGTRASLPGGTENLAESPKATRQPGGYFDAIANLLASVADGLEYAHRNEIVHRDIKPSNLLLADDGQLHISDFGLARILSEPGMTQTGEFVGTPFYMAPEQIRGDKDQIDGRTDVYGLGATLYELLTLRPPFPGTSRDEVLDSIMNRDPTPPRNLNPRVPRDLETICLKAIEKESHRRYQSADALASDLRRYVAHWPIAAKRTTVAARFAKWCRRYPSMAASLLVAFGLGLSAAFLAYRAQQSDLGKSVAERELDEVAARATEIEQELKVAQEAVDRAAQAKQQRVFETALLAAMQGDQDAAKAALDSAIELDAPAGRLHLLRAQVAMFSASFEIARRELLEAIKLMPDSVAPLALLAEVQARSGEFDKNREILKQLEEMEPTSVEDYILLGRMQLNYSAKNAEETLNEAIRLDKQNVVARLIRGTIRTQRAYTQCDAEAAELALKDLNLAASLLPETSYVLSNLLNARLTAVAAHQAAGNLQIEEEHLSAAGTLAEKLAAFPGDYEAHRWRAYYFDRVGDLDQCIKDWQAIDKKTIGYLIMALFRAGRFDEALQACDEYAADSNTGTGEFCHSFVLAAACDTPEELADDFHLELIVPRDRVSAWRATHVLWSLAGMPERAQEEVRKIGPGDDASWNRKLRYEFFSGEISADEYLERAKGSRFERAWGNFVVGVQRLSYGEREQAKRHFETTLSHHYDYSFFEAMSRALLAQLDRDPLWPPWIPAGANPAE